MTPTEPTATLAPANAMRSLYAYSLVPVLSVSLLLFLTAVRRGRGAFGLAAFALTVCAWSFSLFTIWIPPLADLGERFAAIGAFISAGYLHAAYDVTRQRSYRLVVFAYGVAAAITAAGVLRPGLLYGPRAMVTGPMFWPSMALSVTAALVPLVHLYRRYREVDVAERASLRWIGVAGVLTYTGGLSNAVLLSHGYPLPYSMFFVLGGLLVVGHVLRSHEPRHERRLLERSLLYSAVAAFLSAGFLFGVVTLLQGSDEPFLGQYRIGALFLLFMAALAFEPIRQQLTEVVGRSVVKNRAPATAVAKGLVEQEARAEHAQRLAEIGALASAVAHEVRNPLGVLSAHLKLLERKDVDPDTVASMREQIQRASVFVDDLLTYGRPRPLELRLFDLVATVHLATSTAKQGSPFDTDEITFDVEASADELLVEADQAQIAQLFVVLFDNAIAAVHDRDGPQRVITRCRSAGDRLVVEVEDTGSGVPDAVVSRLFEPFVTSRKREGPRPGTGLGLAIAKKIVERHHGRITLAEGALGGACFEIHLPKVQAVLASSAEDGGQERRP